MHAHAALFGVYGNLGLGLTLLSLRLLTVRTQWRTRSLWFAFWSINIGLALMVLLSLLPVGLAQTWASFEHGMWYARSAEFLQTPVLEVFRWLRSIGDTIFAVGILAFKWFVIGLSAGWSAGPVRQDTVPRGWLSKRCGGGSVMTGRPAAASDRWRVLSISNG